MVGVHLSLCEKWQGPLSKWTSVGSSQRCQEQRLVKKWWNPCVLGAPAAHPTKWERTWGPTHLSILN